MAMGLWRVCALSPAAHSARRGCMSMCDGKHVWQPAPHVWQPAPHAGDTAHSDGRDASSLSLLLACLALA